MLKRLIGCCCSSQGRKATTSTAGAAAGGAADISTTIPTLTTPLLDCKATDKSESASGSPSSSRAGPISTTPIIESLDAEEYIEVIKLIQSMLEQPLLQIIFERLNGKLPNPDFAPALGQEIQTIEQYSLTKDLIKIITSGVSTEKITAAHRICQELAAQLISAAEEKCPLVLRNVEPVVLPSVPKVEALQLDLDSGVCIEKLVSSGDEAAAEPEEILKIEDVVASKDCVLVSEEELKIPERTIDVLAQKAEEDVSVSSESVESMSDSADFESDNIEVVVAGEVSEDPESDDYSDRSNFEEAESLPELQQATASTIMGEIVSSKSGRSESASSESGSSESASSEDFVPNVVTPVTEEVLDESAMQTTVLIHEFADSTSAALGESIKCSEEMALVEPLEEVVVCEDQIDVEKVGPAVSELRRAAFSTTQEEEPSQNEVDPLEIEEVGTLRAKVKLVEHLSYDLPY